jgi:hypothetical protein
MQKQASCAQHQLCSCTFPPPQWVSAVDDLCTRSRLQSFITKPMQTKPNQTVDDLCTKSPPIIYHQSNANNQSSNTVSFLEQMLFVRLVLVKKRSVLYIVTYLLGPWVPLVTPLFHIWYLSPTSTHGVSVKISKWG